ncbi:MAG TPA: zf-HC2 domain-containing protein, partial [Acidobacteriaceae bacterium]|nr:zf-HC2 domain-containing protein [Acidobacteriaceae bacterium]
MADRGNIPNSPACGLWETLLADALDGLLRPEDEVTFSSHMAVCPACTALFEEARQGREWLEFLSPEP